MVFNGNDLRIVGVARMEFRIGTDWAAGLTLRQAFKAIYLCFIYNGGWIRPLSRGSRSGSSTDWGHSARATTSRAMWQMICGLAELEQPDLLNALRPGLPEEKSPRSSVTFEVARCVRATHICLGR
jgi:hypothetical protein